MDLTGLEPATTPRASWLSQGGCRASTTRLCSNVVPLGPLSRGQQPRAILFVVALTEAGAG
jgi:hypothetical protein